MFLWGRRVFFCFDCHVDFSALFQAPRVASGILQCVLDPNLTVQVIGTFHCNLCPLRFTWTYGRDDFFNRSVPGSVTVGLSSGDFSPLSLMDLLLPGMGAAEETTCSLSCCPEHARGLCSYPRALLTRKRWAPPRVPHPNPARRSGPGKRISNSSANRHLCLLASANEMNKIRCNEKETAH